MSEEKTGTKKSPVPAEGQGKVVVSDKDRAFAEKCNAAAKHNEAVRLSSVPYHRILDEGIKPAARNVVVKVANRIEDLAQIAAYLTIVVSKTSCEPKEKPVYLLQAYRLLKTTIRHLEDAKEDLARLYGSELGIAMEEERRRGDEAT